jgi:hypothetical protein
VVCGVEGPVIEATSGGLTVSSVEAEVTAKPFESVTMTATALIQDELGEHVMDAVVAEQPGGSPTHAYVYPPEPPETTTDPLTVRPMSVAAGASVGAVTVGSASTVTGSEVAPPEPPFWSVTVTLTVYAPGSIAVQTRVSVVLGTHVRFAADGPSLQLGTTSPPPRSVRIALNSTVCPTSRLVRFATGGSTAGLASTTNGNGALPIEETPFESTTVTATV